MYSEERRQNHPLLPPVNINFVRIGDFGGFGIIMD